MVKAYDVMEAGDMVEANGAAGAGDALRGGWRLAMDAAANA